MTKKANDTYEVISFTETNEGSRMMTKGAMHPWEPMELSKDDSTKKANGSISPINQREILEQQIIIDQRSEKPTGPT